MIDVYMGDGPEEIGKSRGTVFLPIIMGPQPKPEPEPEPKPEPVSPEIDFINRVLCDPRQERKKLIVCPSLMLAAEWRAAGLASGGPWGHVDQFGGWPNDYARRAGCNLPEHYPPGKNNIESIAAGSISAEAIFIALARSPRHSDHLFGRGDFFGAQTHIGVAMVEGIPPYTWYWVIHIGICR